MTTLGSSRSEAPLLYKLEFQLIHQPKDALSATVVALVSQRLLHSPRTIGGSTLSKNLSDLVSELLVLQTTNPLGLAALSVQTAATNPQGPTAFAQTVVTCLLACLCKHSITW